MLFLPTHKRKPHLSNQIQNYKLENHDFQCGYSRPAFVTGTLAKNWKSSEASFSTVTNEVMLFFSVHELILKKSEKQICYVLKLLFQLKCYLDLS